MRQIAKLCCSIKSAARYNREEDDPKFARVHLDTFETDQNEYIIHSQVSLAFDVFDSLSVSIDCNMNGGGMTMSGNTRAAKNGLMPMFVLVLYVP